MRFVLKRKEYKKKKKINKKFQTSFDTFDLNEM